MLDGYTEVGSSRCVWETMLAPSVVFRLPSMEVGPVSLDSVISKKRGKNRELGLLGVIKKKGCIVCMMMNERDKPRFNNLSRKRTPTPHSHRQSLAPWPWKKQNITWMLFSRLCLKLHLEWQTHCRAQLSATWAFLKIYFMLFWLKSSAVHLKLQDKVHNCLRVRRFEDMSRISVFVSCANVCVPLCTVACACVSLLSVWCGCFYWAISWTVAWFSQPFFQKALPTTGRTPPPARAGRQERTKGGRGLLVRAELGGGQGTLVLNLEQLMKGIVSQISPISSLLSW